MTDELKEQVINTALNAVIRYEVLTKIYEDNFIIRIKQYGRKDYIDSITLQSFRQAKTHILVDNAVKRFINYINDMAIDSKNWKTVFDYLSNKEYKKQEE